MTLGSTAPLDILESRELVEGDMTNIISQYLDILPIQMYHDITNILGQSFCVLKLQMISEIST